MCGCTGVEEFCDNLYYIVANDASGEISDEMLMTVDDLYIRTCIHQTVNAMCKNELKKVH